ncbi:hypothetical protein [Mycoplasma sp. SG1]|uniref:hypothetical protein n=1 Tax=Mycoplasma sp. SG1 TaxID=2810348 RepID=UPI0020242717|nr:hypothetical protein [Mycoplasma sp. SG1]URM53084.1 hypothetical protein JRW51_01920 [Mycoplasma sp. SG1]
MNNFEISPENYTLFISNSSSPFSGVYTVKIKAFAFKTVWNKLLNINLKDIPKKEILIFFNHAFKFVFNSLNNFGTDFVNSQQLYSQFDEAEILDQLNAKNHFFQDNDLNKKGNLIFDFFTPPHLFYDRNIIKIFFDISSIYSKDINFYKKCLEKSNDGYHFHKISYLFSLLMYSKIKLWIYLLFISVYKSYEKLVSDNTSELEVLKNDNFFNFSKNKTRFIQIKDHFDNYLDFDQILTEFLSFIFQETELVNKSNDDNYWVNSYLRIIKFKSGIKSKWEGIAEKLILDKNNYYDNLFLEVLEVFKSI